jgi:Transglutaminase-like superfamily
VGLLATSIGLRLASYTRWKQTLGWFVPRNVPQWDLSQPELVGLARAVARLEDSAGRHLPFNASCLEKSLVLCWLLERRGIDAELRIGARKERGAFEAHAWVELGGEVLNDASGEHRHFTKFGREPIAMNTELS